MQVTSVADTQRLEQLALYLAHGIEPKTAGSAVGYSPSRVSQLLATEDFKELVTKKANELASKYLNINGLYDVIEQQALDNLLYSIKIDRNPDLNIRAAMLSNRAIRRGQIGPASNMPLNAADAGRVLQISLSVNLIAKAKNGQLSNNDMIDVTPQEVDTADPSAVQKLLGAFGSEKSTAMLDDGNGTGLAAFFAPID